MAHNLNFNQRTGTWSFASHREKAWHGLGTIVDNAMTAEEAIRLANLGYEVAKAPLFFTTDDQNINVNGHFATYRKDTMDYLGVVKSRYEIIQNSDAFSFFDSIIDRGEAIFETAGCLGKGEKIWLLAKLPEDLTIGGEKVEQYILLTNSHDGTSSLIAGLTNVRVVCNNTLQAALRKGLDNKICIDHVGGAKNKLQEAARVMGIASKYAEEVSNIFNQMTEVKMDEGGYKNYITKILTPEYLQVPANKHEEKEMSTRLKNMVDATLEFALTHPTQTTDASKGTLWGAYNSISGYFQYIKPYNNAEERFKTQLFGTGNTKVLKAFNEAVVMMDN